LFFTGGETPLLNLGFATLTREGLINAVRYSLRLIFLVLGSSLLTLTTAPVTLTDGLERLLSPLKVLHFPAREMAMMMTIALRFIPTLLEEADKIMKAQSARGADFESGRLFERAKAMVPLLVPLFVSAFRRAGDLAMAMEARCYHGGEGRTRLHILKVEKRDWIAILITAVFIALVILEPHFVPWHL
ncbi:MAG: energy-coupling factor transporter transmembrane protein EcfT, partial [Clostridia bacterium]|nr:energy-coupling factor transporter transmembrane protein EcfT [Clostridia bacterium]